ncbi:MAG: triphosphoribosyl-dephospho-CoA synthase CitG [Dorea sp.]
MRNQIPAFNTTSDPSVIKIGNMAWQALLEEVYTTPKPGLVDLYSTGAHADMDVHTFEKSADALRPYFIQMAWQGYYLKLTPEELFSQIRKTGMAAEQAMYRATDHINTHKGLIFTLGIYCAAAGRCMAEYGKIEEETLQNIQMMMTKRILTEEIEQLRLKKAISHGEKNLHDYGTAGIRGEALKGYPSVWESALPTFRQGIQMKHDFNRIKLQTLFVLMSCTEDSNILSRTNPIILRKVQKEAAEFLTEGGAYRKNIWKKLTAMDRDYSKRNISAGGCADLLAVTIFLEKLLDERK